MLAPSASEATGETRIAAVRKTRGLTQRALAATAGIPLSTYRHLERGRTQNPPIRLLLQLALALEVGVDELLEDDWWHLARGFLRPAR